MLELLWLLLPAAAASGWLMAKRSAPRVGTPGTLLRSDIFKGLNYVLNEQPDKAIEVFLRLVEVDNETVETHMALGNLFRRRGEVDRAIRVHQNLIARPTLNVEQRAQALSELAADYMRAGLLDRAEGLYLELAHEEVHAPAALTALVEIYQQERDWERAIEARRKLDGLTGQSQDEVIAQYYCELAEQTRHDRVAATTLLERALTSDARCARANFILGDMAREAGELRAAIGAYRRVYEQDPRLMPEIIGPLRRCYEQLGEPAALRGYLEEVAERDAQGAPVVVLAGLILSDEGPKAAIRFLEQQLQRSPTLPGLKSLIDIHLTEGTTPEEALLPRLRTYMHDVHEERPGYQCRHCGFTGHALYWQCPSCKAWNQLRPL